MSKHRCRVPALLARAAAVVLSVLSLAGTAFADDDPPGRVGRLAETDGTVWIYSPDGNEWVAAARNRPITSGDRVATDTGARAELRVGSTTVRLDGGSELEAVQLDDDRMRWQLHTGSAAVRLQSRANAREFEMLTRDGHFLPQQGGHYRIDRNDETSAVTVWSGSLRFEGGNESLAVEQGQRAEIWSDGKTRYSLSDSEPDAFSDWVAARDREEERIASSRYVSPEMTGIEDLDRHGHWHEHTDYGALWVPRVVAPGWAPYRYGHWSFIRPWGWTWVDDAPWGFAPFHYGRWVHFRGSWGWAPGRYVARPVYAPALVAWIGGPRVSVSVRVGSSPTVGWFPLGPREVYVPGYRTSRRYVHNVNVTHVTNVTNITNVTNVVNNPGKGPHGTRYVNRNVRGAVTIVPADVVTSRRPVAPVAARHVDDRAEREIVRRPVMHTAPVAAPTVAPPANFVPRSPVHARRAGPTDRSNDVTIRTPREREPGVRAIERDSAPGAPGRRAGMAANEADANPAAAAPALRRQGDTVLRSDFEAPPRVVVPPSPAQQPVRPPPGARRDGIGAAPSVRPEGAGGAPSVRPEGTGAPSVRPEGRSVAPSVRPEGAVPVPRPVPGVRQVPDGARDAPGFGTRRDDSGSLPPNAIVPARPIPAAPPSARSERSAPSAPVERRTPPAVQRAPNVVVPPGLSRERSVAPAPPARQSPGHVMPGGRGAMQVAPPPRQAAPAGRGARSAPPTHDFTGARAAAPASFRPPASLGRTALPVAAGQAMGAPARIGRAPAPAAAQEHPWSSGARMHHATPSARMQRAPAGMAPREARGRSMAPVERRAPR